MTLWSGICSNAAALFAGFKDAGARADVGLAPDTEAADGSTSASKEGTA